MVFDNPNDVQPQSTEVTWAVDALADLGSRPLAHHEMEAISRILGDVGSEQALAILGEMASTSGGRLGLMATIAADIDASLAARTSESRSWNISALARMEEDPLAPTDTTVSVAYGALTEAGIGEGALNAALSSRDPLDPVAAMAAFAELAEQHGAATVTPEIEAAVIANQMGRVADIIAQQQAVANIGAAPDPAQNASTGPRAA